MSDIKLLTADQILAAEDIQSEIVRVPEWGGSVRVKGLSGTERDAFEASLLENVGTRKQKLSLVNVRAKLCALTIVDEKGTQLFKESQLGKLGGKSASALDRIYGVAQRLSKISDQDVEELVGN
jgi:hypothetical protein